MSAGEQQKQMEQAAVRALVQAAPQGLPQSPTDVLAETHRLVAETPLLREADYDFVKATFLAYEKTHIKLVALRTLLAEGLTSEAEYEALREGVITHFARNC